MKAWFALLLGTILGLALGLAIDTSPEPRAAPATTGGAASSPPIKSRPAPDVYVDPLANDTELAGYLTLAEFDRQWVTVTEVADVLRDRTEGEPPASEGDVGAADSGSLTGLDHTYRERIAAIELAGRDNAATRLARSGRTQEQVTQGLKELLFAPPLSPRDRRVRRDAALLLGRQADPVARQILLDSLDQPDLFELGANALALAHDPEADAALIAILQRDQDPLRRAGAAAALARTRSLAEGGEVASGLAQVARHDLDPTVRSHAIAALARADLTRSTVARRALLELIADPSEPLLLRSSAVAALQAQLALAHRLPPTVVESLEVLVSTERGPLRREVVKILGQAGGAETVVLLEAVLPTLAGQERAEVQTALQALKRRIIAE